MRLIGILVLVVASAAPGLAQGTIGRANGGGSRDRILERVYLTGRVQINDGSIPPPNTVIERLCFGQVFPDGFTDTKGTFNFPVGSDGSAAVMDSSMAGTDSRGRPIGDPTRVGGISGQTDRMGTMKGTGTVDLTGCEIRANLPGYRSSAIPLTRRSLFENSNIGTLVLTRIEGVSGTTISATSLQAPSDAKKAYEKGAKEMRKPRANVKKAGEQLAKAVTLYPQYAAAWALLGRARARFGDEPGANEAYAMALAADPQFLEPYLPMVKLRIRAGDWTAARMYATNLLMLNPHEAEAYLYKAIACLQLGQSDEAEESLDGLAQASDTAGKPYPQMHHLMGMILAQRGEFTRAAEELRTFLAQAPNAPQAADAKRNLAHWEQQGLLQDIP